jgi:hypothetical protein
MHAQRRHHRLLRRRGVERGRIAIHWARTIVDRWIEREEWRQHQQRRLAAHLGTDPTLVEPDTTLMRMANYPDVVTLAGVLASPQWSAIASINDRRDRLPFEFEIARRLNLGKTGFAWDDPLVTWEKGQAHVRRLQLNQQPNYAGPEVRLAGAG